MGGKDQISEEIHCERSNPHSKPPGLCGDLPVAFVLVYRRGDNMTCEAGVSVRPLEKASSNIS